MAARRAPPLDMTDSRVFVVGSPDLFFSKSSSVAGRTSDLDRCRSKDPSPVISPERGNPRDVLKQALQESITSRDRLQQKVKLFQEALTQETQRNERIEHENDKLVRENAQLREELSASFAELQETQSQKAHLEARNIELSRQVAKAELRPERSSDTLDLMTTVSGQEEVEILRYLNFVMDTVNSVADLRVLFQGRVRSPAELQDAMSTGRWAVLILRLLQVLSDFIVYYADKHKAAELVVKQSQFTQTTMDKSVFTDKAHQHSPSVSSNTLEPESKVLFRFKSSPVNTEGPLSPRFKSTGDEYTRLYEEHRNLLSSLNSQSNRLSKLNSQLSATMSSSRRLLASQNRSLLSSSLSQVREKESDLPQHLEPPRQEAPQIVEAPPAQSAGAPAEAVKTAARNSSARKSKFPIYRSKPAPPRRSVVTRTDREVRVFPVPKEDGWSSVSEFFNSATHEKKKSEGSDSPAET